MNFGKGLAGAAVLIAAIIVSGCETERTSQAEINVVPPTATVHNGESVSFVASGANDYVWTLSDKTLGILSHTTGPETTYTSTSSGGATQTLTVSQGAPQQTTVGTNTTVIAALSASVAITHR